MYIAHINDHSGLSIAQQIIHFFSGIHLVLLLATVILITAIAIELIRGKAE